MCIIIVKILVNSQFLDNNMMFVIFKFTTHSIQHLCCIHTSLSDIGTARKNNDVLHCLMAVQWNTNRNTVSSHFKRQCFPNWKFLNIKFYHVRRQISEVLPTCP